MVPTILALLLSLTPVASSPIPIQIEPGHVAVPGYVLFEPHRQAVRGMGRICTGHHVVAIAQAGGACHTTHVNKHGKHPDSWAALRRANQAATHHARRRAFRHSNRQARQSAADSAHRHGQK